jgi:bacillolysin
MTLELKAQDKIRVFPNPNNGIFTLSRDKEMDIRQVGIFDIMGRKINALITQSASNEAVINITKYTNGIYIISFQNQFIKFIKQ